MRTRRRMIKLNKSKTLFQEIPIHRQLILVIVLVLFLWYLNSLVSLWQIRNVVHDTSEVQKLLIENKVEEDTYREPFTQQVDTNFDLEVLPATAQTDMTTFEDVKSFVGKYPGSRIDNDYLDLLYKECGDVETLKVIISISLAESGMGKFSPRQNNFWGWHLNGNKNHDPNREVMAEQICNGVTNYYPNLVIDGELNMKEVGRYTGNDRPSTWSQNFMWAYESI